MSDHGSEPEAPRDPQPSAQAIMIPDQVQSTIPIHDRPGLKWGYAVSRRGDRVSAYQQNVIPLRIKPPACFSSQEELKAVDRLNAPQVPAVQAH